MITYLKDTAFCIVCSMILIFIGELLGSSFFDLVLQSLLEVIFAVFAINIASAALIAQLLNSVADKTGQPLTKSREVLMTELKLQACMLLISILLLILYSSKPPPGSAIISQHERILYWSKVGLLSIYLYFIWLTYDLGKSLFEVLKSRFR
ncbi:MAG TPA: hypothetical protein VK508_04725 [Cyclobacteriaceae bacterium]|nr:hypothetical protein [Cyclobacteriaceae bacterium]